MDKGSLGQRQTQTQKQIQKLSQIQIQALKYLAMNTRDLREEIFKAVAENPALEMVTAPEQKTALSRSQKEYSGKTSSAGTEAADANQRALEAQADRGETLQQHLMSQLDLMKISRDEYELCQKLIYNLDENGCYGSMLAPETLLDKARPAQNKKMLERCLDLIQHMDPVGTCCRTLEESLFIQAKIAENAPPLALFILDGHIDFLNPPEPAKICRKLTEYKNALHKKAFADTSAIDSLLLDEDSVASALKFILSLNPHPAQGYNSDSGIDAGRPDVVLNITKEEGSAEDDFEHGIVSGNNDFHFQVKYASGALPEVRLSPEFMLDKENVAKAQVLINSLKFRESTIVLQGCAIVGAQKKFFFKGPGHLSVLTRRQVAEELGIHESTVSRMSAKNGSKYIQTEWGLFPSEYFFVSGIKTSTGNTASAEKIKATISSMIGSSTAPLSDQDLTNRLNAQGIKISRRTVNKYRNQLGMENSYEQKK